MAKVSSATTFRDIKLESVSDSEKPSPRTEQKRKMLDNKIPIQTYQNYFDALMSDNAREVDNTLKSCEDAEELNVLLNSHLTLRMITALVFLASISTGYHFHSTWQSVQGPNVLQKC